MNINEENIDEILTAYLLSELNLETSNKVELWINSSEKNRNKFESLKKVWNLSDIDSVQFDTNKAWKKVNNGIEKNNKSSKNIWVGIAASILLLIGTYFIVKFNTNPTLEIEQEVIYANQHIIKDTLIDGSKIDINTNSKLLVSNTFNKINREVTLNGEAYFNVKRNPEKKFIIHTKDCRIEVLGTSFNVKSYDNDSLISLYVNSGKVRFYYKDSTNNSQQIDLIKGEKIEYNTSTKQIRKTNNNTKGQVDILWTKRTIDFEKTPLKEVVSILNEIYQSDINIKSLNLENCLLTASFNKAEGVDAILEVIANTLNFSVNNRNGKYIIEGSGCEM